MKLMKNYAAVLLLGVIVLASSASASWTSQVGGVTTSSTSGATAGNVVTNAVTYDDTTLALTQTLPDGTFLSLAGYDQVLEEYLSVAASVGNGASGSASVSYETNGAQAFAQTTDVVGSYVSTSLEGTVSASVTKDSTDGTASATAYMYALSGIDADTVSTATTGTTGYAALGTTITMDGEGTALAEVADGMASYDAEYWQGVALTQTETAYTKGSVAGNVKLTASNVDDDAISQLGGSVSGVATISSSSTVAYDPATDASDTAVGYTSEYLNLVADRSISYAGNSYIDGYLDGSEGTESVYYVPAFALGNAAHQNTVDIEATSTINGEATAVNRNDHAETTDYLVSAAQIGTPAATTVTFAPELTAAYGSTLGVSHLPFDALNTPANALAAGLAGARTSMSSNSIVTRDTSGGDVKAEAEGYIPEATWHSGAQITGYDRTTALTDLQNHYAYTSGETGEIGNGQTGFGSGAWIQHIYNRPQTATMTLEQEATTTTTGADTATTTYTLNLDGARYTGTLEDAVGAFGGVDNQVVKATTGEDVNTVGYTVATRSIGSVYGIDWLEGTDYNVLPGWFGGSTNAVWGITTGQGALNRFVTVTAA